MLDSSTLFLVALFILANIVIRLRSKQFRTVLEAFVSILFALVLMAEFLTVRQTLFVGGVFFLSITIFHVALLNLPKRGLKKLVAALPAIYLFVFLLCTSDFSYPSVSAKAGLLIGYSYLCFRLIVLWIDLDQSDYKSVSYFRTLDYGFFPPVLLAGPITSFATFSASRDEGDLFNHDWRATLQTTLIGLLKLFVLSPVLGLLTFEPYLGRTGFPTLHGMLLSSIGYYLYLWANFSGYCDVAIGISRVVGVRIDENFNKPFLATNVQEFWARWHITLSSVMRRVVFFPLVIVIGRRVPRLATTVVPALGIFLTFILVGLWHGFALNFLIFGLLHGSAVAFNMIVQRWRAGRKDRAERSLVLPPAVRAGLSRAITFLYVSMSFIFFANDWDTLLQVFYSLNGG